MKRRLLIDTIIEEVADFNLVSRERLLSGRRFEALTRARSQLYYILKTRLNMTPKEVGKTIGKDRSTVLNGLRKIDDVTYPGISREIENILRNVKNRSMNGDYLIQSRSTKDAYIEFVYGENQDCCGIYKLSMV